MSSEGAFDELLGKIADGEVIDWDAAEQMVSTPLERDLLKQLRVLSGISHTHRSTVIDAGHSTMTPATGDIFADAQVNRDVAAAATWSAAPPNRQWGRYRLIRRIGEGGYGAVYLAHDEALKRDLAIKLLHYSARANLSDRVKAEGQALARVRNPNVLTVYDVEEHEHQLGLCMEYIHGRTLEEIVRVDGPMSADEAIAIGQAVCRGLVAVHEAGVLHRDVKARNVMLEPPGNRVVLMDFGAGLDEAAQQSGRAANIGTPVYMAPEVFERNPQTRQSDVYAVGVLLYFLVTGNYPVIANSIDEIKIAHRAGRRTPLAERKPGMRADFLQIVERATAPDPSLRYASAGALLRDLNAAAEPLPKWLRILRATGVGLVVAFALIGLSGLLSSWTFNRVLARSARFDAATTVDVLFLGLQATVLPAATIIVMTCVAAMLQLMWGMVPGLRRLWRRAWIRVADTLSIPERERPAIVARGVVLLGFVALLATLLIYRDMLFTFTVSLSDGDLAFFDPLKPDNARPLFYRVMIPAVLFLVVAGWRTVARVRQTNEGSIPIAVTLGVGGLIVLTVIFLMAPYKLMSRGNRMPVALVEGERCYVLGQDAGESSVYCPGWPVPRVRSVTAATSLRMCGFEENVFLNPGAIGCTRAD